VAMGRFGPGAGAVALGAAAAGVVVLGFRTRLLPTAWAAMGLGTAAGVVAQVIRGGR
jgi:hypothetical protein